MVSCGFADDGQWAAVRTYSPAGGRPIVRMANVIGELIYWAVLPALVAAGTSALVWLLMNARIEVLKSRYHAAVAEVEGIAAVRDAALQAAVEDARARGRQEAFEELLAGVRVEERRYVRKRRRLVGGDEERLVVQERIFLGNIPLTGWMEQELGAQEIDEAGPSAAALASVEVALVNFALMRRDAG